MEVLRSERQPATKKQQAYINASGTSPAREELLEWGHTLRPPRQAPTLSFAKSTEDFLEPIDGWRTTWIPVSLRPGVQLDGEHGL